MAALYGVDRRIEKVEPFEPLKIDCKFDCVMAVATVFDRYHGKGGNIPAIWGASEWLFFSKTSKRGSRPARRFSCG
jgi:hypothetical protein